MKYQRDSNPESQKILDRFLQQLCASQGCESGHHECCGRGCVDNQLPGITGLGYLWDQPDLARHVCRLVGLWACGPPALRAVLCLWNRLWAEKAVRLVGKRQWHWSGRFYTHLVDFSFGIVQENDSLSQRMQLLVWPRRCKLTGGHALVHQGGIGFWIQCRLFAVWRYCHEHPPGCPRCWGRTEIALWVFWGSGMNF